MDELGDPSPCLAESEGIGSRSVRETLQRKRMARISHNILFQLVVALLRSDGSLRKIIIS